MVNHKVGVRGWKNRRGGMTNVTLTVDLDANARKMDCVWVCWRMQCEGQARYTDDIPLEPSQLHGAFVLAPKAGGVLKGVDASFATSCRGVVMFIDAHTMVQSNLANQVRVTTESSSL